MGEGDQSVFTISSVFVLPILKMSLQFLLTFGSILLSFLILLHRCPFLRHQYCCQTFLTRTDPFRLASFNPATIPQEGVLLHSIPLHNIFLFCGTDGVFIVTTRSYYRLFGIITLFVCVCMKLSPFLVFSRILLLASFK